MYNLYIDTFITLQLSSDINEKPKKEPKINTKFLKKEKNRGNESMLGKNNIPS